ncbi:MAG: roadblock/LC7 domain-containing protein [Methanobacteriaceae archaeon]|jgi:predicted regulator of Ras-like GTPase activity (Roadblock/LC7/MglB family)|nr:roadblock/LC7 domain-containing protein [Methanobacteriaceae archaeon]OPY20390.1 MAG: Roadblock/LC7 domain protein [Methanobacterium sp. PtaU1.Bin097]
MKPISEQITETLEEMHKHTDIIESYVIRKDGLILTSSNPIMKNHRIAAMSASLIEIGKKTLKDIGNDDLKRLLITGDKIQIIIMGSSQVALVCSLDSEANIGMVFLRMKRALKRIYIILKEAYLD